MPKSLYRSLEFSEGEESWSSEIYQTAHVSKGSPLEVRCREQHYSCMMDLIILLLPQVTYTSFARMSDWVPINYLVNLTNILRFIIIIMITLFILVKTGQSIKI